MVCKGNQKRSCQFNLFMSNSSLRRKSEFPLNHPSSFATEVRKGPSNIFAHTVLGIEKRVI